MGRAEKKMNLCHGNRLDVLRAGVGAETGIKQATLSANPKRKVRLE